MEVAGGFHKYQDVNARNNTNGIDSLISLRTNPASERSLGNINSKTKSGAYLRAKLQ
ncbi:hypothetical protein [Nostoc sp.]|uniref:hypothetical protein n=1 Tax=Nostoc sp. TaxID=1180 RepID=UPI002FF9B12B